MNFVYPIKTRKEINAVKKHLIFVRDRLLFVLGINSALRISDLLKLKVSDVFDENGKPRKELKVKEKKTGKTKVFPLNRSIVKELKSYAEALELNPEDPLFPSRKKKGGKVAPIDRNHALRIIKKACEDAGVKVNVGTHTLRKTWAYHSYQAGVPLAKLMIALNHSSERETLKYIGIEKEDIDEVYHSIVL
jgi:integrase